MKSEFQIAEMLGQLQKTLKAMKALQLAKGLEPSEETEMAVVLGQIEILEWAFNDAA